MDNEVVVADNRIHEANGRADFHDVIFAPGKTERIFDATLASSRQAYLNWVQVQPNFQDLVLTVHSTLTNHALRDKFRRDFRIDCVLFHPDQEAELHTDLSRHVWMLVTDWRPKNRISTKFSQRLRQARFTVLIDEEFDLVSASGLPIQIAPRKIEKTTVTFSSQVALPISRARVDPNLGATIAKFYSTGGYLHIYVEP